MICIGTYTEHIKEHHCSKKDLSLNADPTTSYKVINSDRKNVKTLNTSSFQFLIENHYHPRLLS